jgi:hypothetical protein
MDHRRQGAWKGWNENRGGRGKDVSIDIKGAIKKEMLPVLQPVSLVRPTWGSAIHSSACLAIRESNPASLRLMTLQ